MIKRLLLATIFLAACCYSTQAAGKKGPSSKEYKILLKAENFLSLQQGCNMFWELVESVALDHKIKVKKRNKSYPDRQICFLDTKDFKLNKAGFILRLRSEEINLHDRLRFGADSEMTLKFRAPDYESTLIAPVKPAPEHTGEVSFEEDIVIKASEPASVFSVSGEVMRPKFIPKNVTEMLEFYPGMRKLLLTGEAALWPVNNFYVVEKRLRMGELRFDGLKAKTIFSAWYRKGSEKPFIGEFSFKITLKDNNPARQIARLERINRFFTDLVKRAKLFVDQGQTKTGIVYQSHR